MKNKKFSLLKITTFALLATIVLFVALYCIFAQQIVDMNQVPDDSGQNIAQGLGFVVVLVLMIYACGYGAIVQLVFGILFATVKKHKGQKISMIVYLVLHAIFVPALLYVVVLLLATFKLPWLMVVATVAVVGLTLFNLVLTCLALASHKKAMHALD